MAVRLNAEKAKAIRALSRKGWSERRIAAQYKIGRSTVNDVLTRKTWND